MADVKDRLFARLKDQKDKTRSVRISWNTGERSRMTIQVVGDSDQIIDQWYDDMLASGEVLVNILINVFGRAIRVGKPTTTSYIFTI